MAIPLLEDCALADKDVTGDALLTQPALGRYPNQAAGTLLLYRQENMTRLRRFAVIILKSFQESAQSIAEMMRTLCFCTRLVFDYLWMRNNSVTGGMPALRKIYREKSSSSRRFSHELS